MKRLLRLLIPIIAIIGILAFAIPAQAATTATVTITFTPEYLAMTYSDGATNEWAIGAVAESTTVWDTADGLAPDEPSIDADGKFTATNTGSIAENFKIHGHNSTGGAGMTLSADATPGENEFSVRAGITGMANEAAMVQVISSDAELIHELATAAHTHSYLEFVSGTFTFGDAQTTTLTITCEKHT